MSRTRSPSRGATGRIPSSRSRRPRRFATCEQAMEYLNARVNIEHMRPSRVDTRAFKLDRMRALLDALGNPQREIRCAHIAGSKGKGSASEMCAAALAGCGYAVGLYTSPHLVHPRERVRIGGRPIDDAAFTQGMTRISRAIALLPEDLGEPTYFEVMTALALRHFAQEAVDIAVIETGLGGRLDATNLVEPDVTGITAIQREHTALLGSTLAEIACEKAGIFKPGVPAVTVPQDEEVLSVLRETAETVGAPLRVLGKEIEFASRFAASPGASPHARVCVRTGPCAFEHVAVPFPGEHQAQNCALALAMLDPLRECGIQANEIQVAKGLAEARPNGRMEFVRQRPRIIIDGAHNPESVRALIKTLGAYVKCDSLVLVFGCASDKDVSGMLSALATGADKVIFTRADDGPRAADPADLAKRFAEISPRMSQVAHTVQEALNLAAKSIRGNDLICVTGSFRVAGEAKRLLAP